MMEKFSKIYETEDHGQIVVMKDTTETGQFCTFFYFKAPETEIVKFEVPYKTKETRDEFFEKFTEDITVKIIDAVKSSRSFK